jgi:site-specific DNA-methyltransferase (adenine-specific)
MQYETKYGIVKKSDAIELLKRLSDESIDLCIFDPSYESLEKWRSTGTTTRLTHSKSSSNDWFPIFRNYLYPELLQELFRVMKPGTFVYIFCDEETRDILCCGHSAQSGTSIEMPKSHYARTGMRWSPVCWAGFKYWKALIFDKVIKGMGYHFPAQHEFILMLEKTIRKGKHRKLNTNKFGDVLTAKRLKGKEYYPTEKPKELIWALITESSNENDVVLDMFCGSGVVPTVAAMTGRKFIAGDISEKAIQHTMKRLAEEGF